MGKCRECLINIYHLLLGDLGSRQHHLAEGDHAHVRAGGKRNKLEMAKRVEISQKSHFLKKEKLLKGETKLVLSIEKNQVESFIR